MLSVLPSSYNNPGTPSFVGVIDDFQMNVLEIRSMTIPKTEDSDGDITWN